MTKASQLDQKLKDVIASEKYPIANRFNADVYCPKCGLEYFDQENKLCKRQLAKDKIWHEHTLEHRGNLK